eukprot:1123536-Amphidinium_carterae.1
MDPCPPPACTAEEQHTHSNDHTMPQSDFIIPSFTGVGVLATIILSTCRYKVRSDTPSTAML